MDVTITINGLVLKGMLNIPKKSGGIVLFAHGSGSSRFSPRNQFVAKYLQDNNLATLLFDLLTPEEEQVDELSAEYRFNIPMLSSRLIDTTDWVVNNKATKDHAIGYFGASTGAAAALISAAQKKQVKAVVSRGGRVDLATDYLKEVTAPTLLICGEYDETVIDLNKEALKLLKNGKLEIVPKASHLFEEQGRLEIVAKLAKDWFSNYLL